ncbi:MAG: hypothetical protein HEQ21_04605 [Blastomonas sp.]|uniref:hypothetical protein n=1 Tax=Blastomonas sp. TaxID=1909299 RepID=UPI00258E7446|nr:hypothetical protein [Blastomonas sp.]MCO5792079.1 hypothetical protein [Blastomonas sp.]
MLVASDLRHGSLASLATYLKQHQGIPDREIAFELWRLLAGSATQSRFRLVVVDHPDAPADKGGRPATKSNVPTARDRERVAEFSSKLDVHGKVYLAREEAATTLKKSESTVKRAIRKVEAAEVEEVETNSALARRAAALKKLRQER